MVAQGTPYRIGNHNEDGEAGLSEKIKGKGKNNSVQIALTKAGEEAYHNSEKIQSIKEITSI